jgi:hypothetical protein
VKGNSGKVQQVFLNLFLNARDAMPAGGTLKIRTWSEDDAARIEVSDTGDGIPPEYLARIYDPFFTTKGPKKGTGLGLSVSYGIVREHGGNIEVTSKLGKGTAFLLTFPLFGKSLEVPAPATPVAAASPDVSGQHPAMAIILPPPLSQPQAPPPSATISGEHEAVGAGASS